MESQTRAAALSQKLLKGYNDRNIQTKLINALDINNDKLTIDFPKRRKTEKFKFKWCYEIPPSGDMERKAAQTIIPWKILQAPYHVRTHIEKCLLRCQSRKINARRTV